MIRAVSSTEGPVATAETIDLTAASPAWTSTGSMVSGPRKLFNATLLPNGNVFVSGGSRGLEDPNSDPNTADIADECEMWNPDTGDWSARAKLTAPGGGPLFRGYHSVALLLPDGRVLSGGGDKAGGPPNHLLANSAEYYSPPYLFNGSRPTITSVSSTDFGYGATLTVETPNGSSISRVSMLTLGSVTHGFNMGQRINFPTWWSVTNPDNSVDIKITAPTDPNRAPPGYYILFILNGNGVPSVAEIVRLHL